MSGWIVRHIPAGMLLVLLIVLIAGGAVLLQMVVRRRFPGLTGAEHNDVTRFTYGFIGFVYAFFIGFVVSAMWARSTPQTAMHAPKAQPRCRWQATQSPSTTPTATGSGEPCATTRVLRKPNGMRSQGVSPTLKRKPPCNGSTPPFGTSRVVTMPNRGFSTRRWTIST